MRSYGTGGITLGFFSRQETEKSIDKSIEVERLINEYGNDVLRTAYMYLKDMQRAEDAFQEVFIKVFKSYDRFRGECNEKTWIIRITINVCKDIIKGFWFKRVVPDEEVVLSAVGESVENEVLDNLENQMLFQKVLDLKEAYKDVIILYYYHGYSTAEISKILSIPEGTVRSRLSRAREMLKKKITEGGIEGE